MEEKELLELSAKAAGFTVLWVNDKSADNVFLMIEDQSNDLSGVRWNPLADDGDALRLAVKLQIDILNHEDFCVANTGKLDCIINEDHISDPLAAARRAITRAAAEIGKSL